MTEADEALALEEIAVDVARRAAAEVRSGLGAARVAHTKSSPTDVVTEHDLRSEELIRAALHEARPGSSILGEEYGTAAGSTDVGWIVDPIDGTVNFLYGLSVVGVSIAATLDGVVVAGAVADVRGGEVFSAHLGGGARCDGIPVAVSNVDTLDEALVGTGFSYQAELRAEQAEVVALLLPRCRDIRCMGSAALNLCFVASGRLDAYYERDLKVYDHAAGALIAREGGAEVVAADGDDDLTFAVSPKIAASLAQLIAGGP